MKAGRHFRFRAKAFEKIGRGGIRCGDDFKGHRAVEADLPGAIDGAHAATCDRVDDFIVAETPCSCRGSFGFFVRHQGGKEARRAEPFRGALGKHSNALPTNRSRCGHAPVLKRSDAIVAAYPESAWKSARISSSTSAGVLTVSAISARMSSRKRRRSRCTKVRTPVSAIPSRTATSV